MGRRWNGLRRRAWPAAAEPPFDDVAPFGGARSRTRTTPPPEVGARHGARRRAPRGDPAERLERARALAWRALDRRERTELELRGILAEKRVAPEEAAVVLGELLEGGFVDDAGFACRSPTTAGGSTRGARSGSSAACASSASRPSTSPRRSSATRKSRRARGRARAAAPPRARSAADAARARPRARHARPQGLRPRSRASTRCAATPAPTSSSDTRLAVRHCAGRLAVLRSRSDRPGRQAR